MKLKVGNYARYLKFLVGVIGSVLAGLQQAFPGAHWVTLVTLGVTPLLVYLVPNAPKSLPQAAGKGSPSA